MHIEPLSSPKDFRESYEGALGLILDALLRSSAGAECNDTNALLQLAGQASEALECNTFACSTLGTSCKSGMNLRLVQALNDVPSA